MDSYRLYLDKSNSFQCHLQLEGASLDTAHARLILEGRGRKMLFEGSITSDGNCEINLERLQDIFKDGDAGKMKLEIIAEDAYFNPWESDFNVDLSRKVTVEVASVKEAPRKPTIAVNVVTPPQKEFNTLVETVTKKLKTTGVNVDNIKENKKIVTKLISESMKECAYDHRLGLVISEIVKNLTS